MNRRRVDKNRAHTPERNTDGLRIRVTPANMREAFCETQYLQREVQACNYWSVITNRQPKVLYAHVSERTWFRLREDDFDLLIFQHVHFLHRWVSCRMISCA